VLGEVVAKCWKVEYKNIGEAKEDIMHIQKKLEDKHTNAAQNKDERAWWSKR
jgi:hypothetical protein